MTDHLSPLHHTHVAAGATFTDFAGWQMPVRYTSDLAEHHAVRTAAGLFDISHMAEIIVEGPEAPAFLDYALAGLLSTAMIGQAKYSLLLTERGTVIDDLVVYRLTHHSYLVVANAGNRFAAVRALVERAVGFDVAVTDRSDDYALIAVQGPRAQAVLEQTTGLTVEIPLDELKYYRSTSGSFSGVPLLVGRTGYTGEDGFELYIAAESAAAMWAAVALAGAGLGLVPAGLACRDTLRLEAGMPLYGHELSLDVFPAQAGLDRVVALTSQDSFVGREGTEVGPADGAWRLVGLAAEGRRAARAGYPVFASVSENKPAGIITSGALSPTLGHPIALAFVEPSLAEPGTEVSVDIRGKRLSFAVTALPFYRREKK
ncbi:glycine cleavage system aminomethyltransferase GcvT [Klugiella xanthotipulae]|uniref:Aminomethyltransferase n=1 Tax=Klugiella xanthotipulae TaxID=244735 RepID=A0A543HXU9_9MICO|nr:glycine cleavage system aminomethyltransferase GcvT [Klugiella xanthotipulae]TQM63055.1 aminomethyltransferase [Klugiella xanthotipulae]